MASNGNYFSTSSFVPITPNFTNSNSTPSCEKDMGDLIEDVPCVVACAIAIVFNLLIIITNLNRRANKKRMEGVLIQFTVLALTDCLASLTMLLHYSQRMSYGKKADLEQELNDRFIQNNQSCAILANDGKVMTYIGFDFMLAKKIDASCGKLEYRYYTSRWLTEASTRLVLIYINISRTVALYKPNPVDRSEKSAILNLSLVAFAIPALSFMVIVVAIYLKVNSMKLLGVVYVMTYVMPFFILLVTAILLIHKIRSIAKAVAEIKTTMPNTTQGRRRQTTGHNAPVPKTQGRAERNRNQLIAVVIVVTVAYLLTHLAGLIYLIAKSGVVWKPSEDTNSFLSRVTPVMIAVNSLVNFPMFLCISEQFLSEFRKLFGCFQPGNRLTRTSVENPSKV